jgi:hydroxymethylbilane synthase
MAGRSTAEIVVGSRGSLLALAQTRWVIAEVQRHHADLTVRIERISTAGDHDQASPLPAVGQKGIFTRELEDALLDGRIDLAVHSAKDLPEQMPPGLDLLCIPAREDPRDALVSRHRLGLDELPPEATVGTSSLRRQALLRLVRKDLRFCGLRGNVDTRIRKVQRGDCDATLLAMAGLQRVHLADQATGPIDVERIVPAPGQGVLAVQGRGDDDRLRSLLEPVHDRDAALALRCEREMVTRLQGGCRTPIGLLATVRSDTVSMIAVVASPDGTRCARADASGPRDRPARVIEEIIARLTDQGAAEIIEACRE